MIVRRVLGLTCIALSLLNSALPTSTGSLSRNRSAPCLADAAAAAGETADGSRAVQLGGTSGSSSRRDSSSSPRRQAAGVGAVGADELRHELLVVQQELMDTRAEVKAARCVSGICVGVGV